MKILVGLIMTLAWSDIQVRGAPSVGSVLAKVFEMLNSQEMAQVLETRRKSINRTVSGVYDPFKSTQFMHWDEWDPAGAGPKDEENFNRIRTAIEKMAKQYNENDICTVPTDQPDVGYIDRGFPIVCDDVIMISVSNRIPARPRLDVRCVDIIQIAAQLLENIANGYAIDTQDSAENLYVHERVPLWRGLSAGRNIRTQEFGRATQWDVDTGLWWVVLNRVNQTCPFTRAKYDSEADKILYRVPNQEGTFTWFSDDPPQDRSYDFFESGS